MCYGGLNITDQRRKHEHDEEGVLMDTVEEEARYLYTWRGGVRKHAEFDRGAEFDEWLRSVKESVWDAAAYEHTGYTGPAEWRRDNPYRKEENA